MTKCRLNILRQVNNCQHNNQGKCTNYVDKCEHKVEEATENQTPSGQAGLVGYKPGWYWMTVVSEGDTWYPIYINEEYCLMDGKRHDLGTLKDLIIKPAVLPTGL